MSTGGDGDDLLDPSATGKKCIYSEKLTHTHTHTQTHTHTHTRTQARTHSGSKNKQGVEYDISINRSS